MKYTMISYGALESPSALSIDNSLCCGPLGERSTNFSLITLNLKCRKYKNIQVHCILHKTDNIKFK